MRFRVRFPRSTRSIQNRKKKSSACYICLLCHASRPTVRGDGTRRHATSRQAHDHRGGGGKRLGAFTIDDLTVEEEEELRKYLAFLRFRAAR